MLSILMITKNSEELLEQSLSSVSELSDNIVIVDDYSTDNTVTIAKKYKATIYQNHNNDLGVQRSLGLSKCKGKWVLMLDADEIITDNLRKEITLSISDNDPHNDIVGYYIPYQNHLFGKPIYFGGEDYKVLRLFKRKNGIIRDNAVHEHVEVRGKTNTLNNKIFHYSYRRPIQVIRKFTDYAKREAKRKTQNNEKSSIRKLTFYPFHMVWARYIKDKGYKDGIIRLFLDLAFGYMEFYTYLFLFYENNKNRN